MITALDKQVIHVDKPQVVIGIEAKKFITS